MANAKLDIDIAGFQNNINTAKGILKGLNAEMKNADAEFKATGNAEKALADKTKTLNSQLQVQKEIADQAQQALKAMDDAGVKPTDAAYQKLYVTMMNANAGMNEAQAALNGLSTGEKQAAQEANNLTTSVQGISKKMSLDQVISGIDRITSGLENAAKKAINLGTELWNAVMDSAKRADDTATMAEMYGIDLDTFMKMQKLVTGGMDTSVDAMLGAQDKLKKGIGKGNQEVMGYLEELGLAFKTVKGDVTALVTSDTEEMFWRAGKAIMAMGDAYDKEAAATALFGKSWKELKPLFDTYEDFEAYKEARDKQVVNDEQTIRDLAALNDAVGNLESSWTTLKDEMLGAIAPALEKGAEAISGLLDSLTEYAKSDEGQELLGKIGTAIEGLIDDIANIDPEKVVSGFVDVVNGLVSGLEWIKENKDGIVSALKLIVEGWAGLKLMGGALEIMKLINGLKDLGILGGGSAAAGGGAGIGGTAAGVAVTGMLSNILPKAASWSSVNGGPVMDWFIHESPLATVFNGMESLGDWWERQKQEFQGRKDTFSDDWAAVFGGSKENKGRNSAGLTDEEINKMRLYYQFLDNVNRLGYDKVSDESKQKFAGYQTWLDEAFQGREKQWNAYRQAMAEALRNGQVTLGDDFFNIGKDGKPVDVPAELDIETTAQEIVTKVGEVKIPVTLDLSGYAASVMNFLGIGSHANGLPFVPYDNYLARLHKGERVVPAREIQSRSFNSNLYVESMYMNNGADADGLAAAMAAAQRRTMSGFGS